MLVRLSVTTSSRFHCSAMGTAPAYRLDCEVVLGVSRHCTVFPTCKLSALDGGSRGTIMVPSLLSVLRLQQRRVQCLRTSHPLLTPTPSLLTHASSLPTLAVWMPVSLPTPSNTDDGCNCSTETYCLAGSVVAARPDSGPAAGHPATSLRSTLPRLTGLASCCGLLRLVCRFFFSELWSSRPPICTGKHHIAGSQNTAAELGGTAVATAWRKQCSPQQ
jgi:hypothetical protein